MAVEKYFAILEFHIVSLADMGIKHNTNYLHLLLNGHWTLELRIVLFE